MSVTVPLPVASHADDAFALRLQAAGQSLQRHSLATLQLNLGKRCNLACHHCHVESGPNRSETMTWETMGHILAWIDRHRGEMDLTTVDLTGGAPEMNPHFRLLVNELRDRDLHVLDRCNLTILLAPGYEDLIPFLAGHRVEVVASLPCYLPENVDRQRGRGVYHDSIEVLRRLNAAGYGLPGSDLRLDLVYNPAGDTLPPDQQSLERDYKRELAARFGLHFHRLWTLTNMPIRRFEHALRRDGKLEAYLGKLMAAHNPANVAAVMCRTLVSVGWGGTVYDCDFNQMLGLAVEPEQFGPDSDEHKVEAEGRKLWEYAPADLVRRHIRTGRHCFGCTAGAGSSCTGALGG